MCSNNDSSVLPVWMLSCSYGRAVLICMIRLDEEDTDGQVFTYLQDCHGVPANAAEAGFPTRS